MARITLPIEEWIQRVNSTPADQKSAFIGMSPGGVAQVLDISRQAVHQAIDRDKMDAYYLMRGDHCVSILVPDGEVENYRRNHLRKAG